MTFEEYLTVKKIDQARFQAEEPRRWKEWSTLFDQISPSGFTAQKLYLINALRRKFPLNITEPSSSRPAPTPVIKKPIFKPKIQ
jgi:hypothetical protein